ncbi:hypothetical protein HYH03_006114 [Edaphochlamys debaryana]|uniref:Amino acid transporter transmembrane domain-containing protein n=1 Tax=Edaphochlamys debaryana TaxID=47281 RepID=A0A835Y802_9CHLO|nr:hypothetical protein HYH03_006114 [Edaphochlamys debaryana]|eukprot:KAG2495876.1 hypothetical protein HYH03_006114 [Edaphochlamys debaryana]
MTRSPGDIEQRGLEAPLLHPSGGSNASSFHHSEAALKSNFWDCTLNLTKVILGAGIMALPRAVALLGWGAGLALLLSVGVLTHFTVHGLVYASDRLKQDTYSGLVRAALGPLPEKVLQLAMLFGCLGFEVVYVDIIGDLLLGEAPQWDGLITTWLPAEDRTLWFVGRPFVLLLLAALVLAPLASLRTMGHLGAVNAVGLLSLVFFAGTTVWLGAAAALQGTGHSLPAAPDWGALGRDTASRATALLAVVPILLTAASCHQSVHPLRAMLHPYSGAALDRIVALSLAAVTALFLVVTFAAYTAFGSDIRGNFLNNLSVPELAPLLGATAAPFVSFGIKGGYAVSLVGSAVLIMFPLRQSLLEMLVPAEAVPGGPPVRATLYLGCTYGLLATVYVIAVFVPSIWDVISFVGAVACTIMCFIIPGLLLVKYKDQRTWSHWAQRAAARAVVLLGVLLFLNVFVGLYMNAAKPAPAAQPPVGTGLLGAGAAGMEGTGPGADGGVWELAKWAGWGA